MSCTIDDEGLKCTFPESYETVNIFSHPVDAEQRSVGSCVRLTVAYTCTVDKGFGAFLKNVSQLLVTLPDTVKENESFFCQVGYDPKVACQWNRKGSDPSDITNQSPTTAEGEGKQSDAIAPFIVIPIIPIICIFSVALLIIYLRKKLTSTKTKRAHDLQLALELIDHISSPPTLAERVNDAQDEPTLRTPLLTPPPELLLQHLKMMARPELLTEEHIENAKRMLFPEQAALLEQSPPKLFLTGPRGTGKTMVLFLKSVEWLRKGEDVYIVSTWLGSRAVTILLHKLMLRCISPQQTERLHLLLYELTKKKEVDKIVHNLLTRPERKKLYVIADEVAPPFASFFNDFCDQLLAKVPDLHFWAASCFTPNVPSSFQAERLTRPIRYPLQIVKEEEKQEEIIEKRTIDEQSRLAEPDSGNNSPVKHLYHRGNGHSEKNLANCSTCGQELAEILHSFRNGVLGNVANSTSVPSSGGRTSPLEWRDMLVLHPGTIKDGSSILVEMKDRGIPVQAIKNLKDIDDAATASSDVVWVADEYSVLGLERAIVVCLGDVDRLHSLSRWCLHLVVCE